MTSSERRHSSKLDSKEESCIAFENMHDSGKSGLSFHDTETRDRLSPHAAAGNHSKWSVPEPLPARRGTRRDDGINGDRNRNSKGVPTWEVGESYGTRMSPGLDDWREPSHHSSPKNEQKRSRRSRSRSQSRSRSRSPIQGFGRESGLNDKSRSRSGALAQICKDYASGWCRRGNHCHFLHGQTNKDGGERQRKSMTPKYPMPHDSRGYSSGSGQSTDYCTEFLKGSCRRGSSCRFAHHGASHASGKMSSDEASRGRNSDRRETDASFERHNDKEPRRAAAIPCKFFAAGNCRNGKYCRFSHQDQTYSSPDRSLDRSLDGRLSLDHGSGSAGKLYNKWGTSDTGNPIVDKDEIIGSTNQRVHHLEEDEKLSDSIIDNKIVENKKNEVIPWNNGIADDCKLDTEQRISEEWLGDMDMSPEWNYNVQTSKPADKQASITNCNPNMIKQAAVQMHDATIAMPSERNEHVKPLDLYLAGFGVNALSHDNRSVSGTPGSHGSILPGMIAGHSINQNGLISNALPLTGLRPIGQGQGSVINVQLQMAVQDGKAINKPNIVEPTVSQLNTGVAITQNNVSNEQLNTISASIAQLLANGQQFQQLYGSLAHNMMETSHPFGNEMPIKKDSAVNTQSNENTGMKQYDPTYDSVEPVKHEVSNSPAGFFPAQIIQKNIANENLEITLKNKISSSAVGATDSSNNNEICVREEANDKNSQINQLEKGGNSVHTKENNRVETEESTKVEENRDELENGRLENIDGDEKTDDGRKGKETKVVRAFKFALVEFVKELMKPTWKEGQMSKDAYKNIVKKVVEKVTGTMQGANIPQTQEKIKQYLSFSKPKLTKLVQAYVEKFQKVNETKNV